MPENFCCRNAGDGMQKDRLSGYAGMTMKLRIQNDSLRLRLTQKEVAALHDEGLVECAIHFPPGRTLHYSVATSADATAVSVNYAGDAIRVILPDAVAASWTESNLVTI